MLHCWGAARRAEGGCLQRVLLLQRQEAGGQLRGGCLWLVLHCSSRRAEDVQLLRSQGQLQGGCPQQVLFCSGWSSEGSCKAAACSGVLLLQRQEAAAAAAAGSRGAGETLLQQLGELRAAAEEPRCCPAVARGPRAAA